MHDAESSLAVLQRLRKALARWSEPSQLSDARFDQTHEHFERSSNQQLEILAWLKQLVRRHFASIDPLKILSVGCGNGILDNPLIECLAMNSERLDYTGVDPSDVACRRFRHGFETMKLPNVRLDVREQQIEALRSTERFDLVHAVHSLYYFSDPAATLERLIRLLRPAGRLVIVQAPHAELNQLANCFWSRHTQSRIWFSDCLAQHLAERDVRFTRHRIDGWVDVSRCFHAGCSRGTMLLDFITQSDCRQLHDSIRELCLSYLQTISRREADRLLVAHPADAFVIHPLAGR